MRARYFFTTPEPADGTLIGRVTGGRYTHTGVVFYPGEGEGAHGPEYYESHWNRNPTTGKTGVRGPLPISKLYAWQMEKPEHQLELLPAMGYLPWTDQEALEAREHLEDAATTVSYAKLQLVQNWLAARLGLQISWRGRGAQRWTCSETALRVAPAWTWRYYGVPTFSADYIAPSGDKLPSIYEGTLALLDAHPPRS